MKFENYNSDNGLSQNSVFSIAQTKDGFLWFGTQDGLNRFDGKIFTKYYSDNITRGTLAANYFHCLLYDTTTNLLWITMKNGVTIYDYKIDSFLKIEQIVPEATILNRLSIKKVFQQKKNIFWFISFDDGVFCVDTDTRKMYRYFEDDFYKDKITSIELFQNRLIIASLNTLFSLNDKNQFEKIILPNNYNFTEIKCLKTYANKLWIGSLTNGCWYIENLFSPNIKLTKFNTTSNEIGCFAEDFNHNLWIGTRGAGLLIYNDFTKSISIINKIDYDERSLKTNFLLSLFVDRQGIVWCGLSGGGVCKYDPLKFQFTITNKEPLNKNSLADNMIFCIHENENYINYGSQNGGLIQYDKKSKTFRTFNIANTKGMIENTIYGIAEESSNKLWLASWSGLMLLDIKLGIAKSYSKSSNLKSIRLYTVLKMKQADSLFITGNFGSVFFNLKTNQWNNCIDKSNWQSTNNVIGRHVYEDNNSILWIATESDGLIKYDYKKGIFEPKTKRYKNISNSIRYILPFQNDLWLATDKGIIKYNLIKDSIENIYGKKEGLSSNVVYAIQKDNNNFLWASTNNGLFYIDPKTGFIKNYNKSNGISFDEFNTACVNNYNKEVMSFGGVGGVVSFNPSNLKENTYKTNPIITNIIINGKTLSYQKSIAQLQSINLNYQENNIQIYFTANNFSNTEKNQFAYRLVGTKENWIYCTECRSVSYSQLKSGKYTFEIKTANSDGYWSDTITQLKIIINPPFWETWWFITSMLLFTAILVFFLIKKREQNLKIKAEEKLYTQKIKTEQIQQQLEMEQINNYFTYSVADKNNIDDILWDVVKNLIGKLGFEDCIIYLWNNNKTKMIQKAGYGPKGPIEEINKLPYEVMLNQGIVGFVMHSKEAIIINDTSNEPRYRQDEVTRLSEICVPIIYNADLIGIIDSEHHQKNFYTQRHLQIMTTIAALIANKIVSIESEKGLQQKQLEVANLNVQLAEYEMKALHTQMNPHFIFNSLGTIKSMIQNDEKENASKYLSKFAKMIRLTLNHSTEAFISLQQNNEYINYYLEIESMRFNFAFTFDIIIDPNINSDEIMIPPMMIQPLVENAIWHGLLKKEGKKELKIQYSLNNEILTCSIIDNGVGINNTLNDQNIHQSVGLQNIKERLQLLNEKYNKNCALNIKDRSEINKFETGTIATLTLPYIN